MTLREVEQRTPELIWQLTEVWEASVRATHRFLTEPEIQAIKEEVPEALRSVPHLVVAEDGEGRPAAFLGTAGAMLEMLFLAPGARGQGLGGRMLRHAVQVYGVSEVSVNEQNPQAVGFYEHLGFRTYRRTDRDEQGRPYSILYMRRDSR